MKKIIGFFIFVFICFQGFSQFSIGPKVGYTSSDNTISSDGFTVSKVPGVQFGLQARIGNEIAFQTELLYSQKGMQVDSVGSSDYVKIKANYFEVPLLLNFGIGKKDLRFFLNFGPYIGYWLDGKIDTHVDGQTHSENYEFDEDLEDDGIADNRWDYGFCGGAGAKLKFKNGFFLLEARYDYGFDDIVTMKDVEASSKTSHTRSISASLAYVFVF
jgi:outer membrane protein with beta-barrel domain